VGRVVALYLLLGGGYLIAWFLAPAPAFLFFVLLTWFHWGQGELYPLSALAGAAHLDGRLARAGTVLVRGGLPMLVPLLSFPERYRSVAETVVTLFGADGAWLAWLFGADVRLALGGAFGLVTVATLALGFVRARPAGAGVAGDDTADGSEDAIPGGRRAWALDAGEVGLLWAFFLVVPPVLAIGVYFAVWHSLRHVARLVALDPRATDAVAGGSVVAPALRFARDAAPNTVGALALFATLALAVPGDLGSVASFGGVYLVVLAALTLPHVVIVTELDLTQGILGRRGDGETAPTGG
jgi:Brp/Blh family beta-carotene 15,15'-monooxygenase